MLNPSNNIHPAGNVQAANQGRSERRFQQKRRKKGGMLAFYLAGGPEHRYQNDRRQTLAREKDSLGTSAEKRVGKDRRNIVKSKYIDCGRIMDRRDAVRRQTDRIDPEALERESMERLGPGWL